MSPFVRPAIVRLGDRLCARSVLLVLLGIFTATYSGLPEDLRLELDFQTARSLAHGRLALSDTPEARAAVHAGEGVRLAADGDAVADRPLGAPLLSVPLYAAGKLVEPLVGGLEERHAGGPVPRSEYAAHLAVGWRNSLAAALLAWLVALSARRTGTSRRSAWLAGLALGFTTFLWPQARSWSVEVPATCLLFVAFHLLLRARERFERLLRPSRPELAGFGAALGLAVATLPIAAPSALVLAVAFVVSILAGYRRLAKFALFLRRTWRLGHWVDIAWAAVPLALALAPLAAGGVSAGDLLPGPSDDPAGDLLATLASPGRGLVWVAPLVCLAPFGLWLALERGARTWPACALLAALPFFWAAHPPLDASDTWGFGPARLLPALPFLWLLVAGALDALERHVLARRATYALCALGFAANLPGVLVDSTTYQELLVRVSEERSGPELYRRAAWEPRLAQPWAHWRILRHRLAGLGDVYRAEAVFLEGGDAPIEPHRGRDRGFAHMAWIDLRDRLGGRPFPPLLLALVAVGAGCVMALRGLDPALP